MRCLVFDPLTQDLRVGNTGAHGPLYLDGNLLQRYLKHTHDRTEQEVYAWMTISDMGFPVTQEREEVQWWWDIVEDRLGGAG